MRASAYQCAAASSNLAAGSRGTRSQIGKKAGLVRPREQWLKIEVTGDEQLARTLLESVTDVFPKESAELPADFCESD